MDYALTIFPTQYSIDIRELAQQAEQRGFEALLVPEHTHIPASRRTPFPGGGELPRHYYSTYDPFVALATAAAVTKKLRIGTGICLVIERDPITLAKEVASLDVLSGGRFIFGIGAGWNAEEMENHGTQFNTRRRVLREKIEAMKAIWTQQAAEYHGQFVNFDPIWSDPKPLQKPHPPILIGGSTPAAMRAALRYCDGWMPIPGRGGSDPLAEIQQFRRLAQEAGRDPQSIPLSLFMAPSDRKLLDRFAQAGVQRAIFALPSDTREKVMPLLDRYAALMQG
ncbi:MAG TPA: LLM class F420-dependent oxidoreductase [Candidatus Binataceae bacterium]|nr:LLM class F420-dependent oxidoreductase [Candidatus Binataceae bacterium]